MKIREIKYDDFKNFFKLLNQFNNQLNNCEDVFINYLLILHRLNNMPQIT